MAHETSQVKGAPKATLVKETLERELKLIAGRGFHLPDLPGEPLKPRVFTSTYFDTTDHRLAAGGITLRRRVEGGKGLWQLKLPRDSARLELEFPGGSLLPPQTVRDLLFARLRGHELTPIAKLRTWRTGIRVRDVDRPVADVVFDSVTQLDGRRVIRRFSEVEAELTGGDDTTLARIEALLHCAGAGKGDGRPKVFQAIGIPLKQPAALPSPSAPVIEHVQAGLRAQLDEILAHDPGTRLGTDLEELHDMRVATRRLRALLRVARPMLAPDWVGTLRAEMAWLGKVLGRVRDLDALIQYFHAEAGSLDPRERRSFERLLGCLQLERAEGRSALLDALRSDRYLVLLDSLEKAVKAPEPLPVTLSLREIAAAEFKKLRRAVLRLASEPSDQALHRVRIKARRARYTAELAEVAAGKAASRFIQRMKTFQDVLGEHQDAVVVEDRVRQLVSHSRGRRTLFAAGVIVERQRARRRAARAVFQDLWSKVEKRGCKVWL